ncbi:MAG: hypothetical protein WCR01_07715 [Bacteroidota bacterium]
MKKQLLFTFLSILFSVFCFGQAMKNLPLTAVNLPVTFDDPAVNYDLVDFGGNASSIVADPVVLTNMVCKVIKTNTAETWAGTTIGGTVGFATVVPFAPGATFMTMRVYSPDAGTPVRMKVEDPNDPTKSVETQVLTTVANAWETLTFNFAIQAPGTAAINFSYIYKKLSVFFNFGTTGAAAGTKTYYCDDIAFGGSGPSGINVTFQVQSPDIEPVYVFGNWSGWGNWPGDQMMLVGPGLYAATLPFSPNSTYEYLFVNGSTPLKEVLNPAWPCTNGNAQYTNRVLTLGSSDTTVCFIWSTCSSCGTTSVNSLSNDNMKVSLSKDGIRIFSNMFVEIDQIGISDLLGRTVYFSNKKMNINSLIPLNLNVGCLYLISVKVNNQVLTVKGVVQN